MAKVRVDKDPFNLCKHCNGLGGRVEKVKGEWKSIPCKHCKGTGQGK